jgi:hypothetical protein
VLWQTLFHAIISSMYCSNLLLHSSFPSRHSYMQSILSPNASNAPRHVPNHSFFSSDQIRPRNLRRTTALTSTH